MRRYFHFTITSDAKRQIPKMILERLADEYLWQEKDSAQGTTSVKERAQRIRKLIEAELKRRDAQPEFERLISDIQPEKQTG